MNKRIICLILTVVMLALSLAGCNYSYADDDLTQYVDFDKAAWDKAIAAIVIEDGEFTEKDHETRAKKVLDEMFAAIASASTSTEDKTGGVIGAHDLIHYCYYVTFMDGEKLVQLAPDYMKTGKAVELQNGKQLPTEIEKEILDKIANYDFTDKAYSNRTIGRAEAGQVAYISYTYSYTQTVDGNEKVITGTVTQERVILDAADPIHVKLISTKSTEEGKENELVGLVIGTTVSEKITINEGYQIKGEKIDSKVEITKAKIEFIEDGEKLTTFTEKTYTEKQSAKDIYGNEIDLKDKELTYHIYASSYTPVDELNATNIINLIYGKSLTEATVKSLLFGVDFAEKTEEAQKKLTDAFEIKNGSSKLTFTEAVEALVKALSDYDSANSTLSTEKSNLTKAESDYATKKAAAEKEGATKDEKDAAAKAKESVETYTKSVATAKSELEKATYTRDQNVVSFLTKDADFAKSLIEAKKAYDKAVADEANLEAKANSTDATDDDKAAYEAAKTETASKKAAYDELNAQVADKAKDVEAAINKGYEDITYDKLQASYRADIKTKLATQLYSIIEKTTKVKGTPEDAVDEVYEKLYDDYQYKFYNGTVSSSGSSGSSSSSVTNYTQYKGSFKSYLIAAVSTDLKSTVKTYDEACNALRAQAVSLVDPVLRYSAVANALGLTYTDEEFEKHKDEDINYTYNESQYGESTVRNSLQFDKLMNHFLASEEVTDKETDERYANDKYTKIEFTFSEEE